MGVWIRAGAAVGMASGTFALGFFGTERAFKEYDRWFPEEQDQDDGETHVPAFGYIGVVRPAQPLERKLFNLLKERDRCEAQGKELFALRAPSTE